tara:strand:- start:6114 stop:6356 length:243 start_codon:yes stop_codon:yes gene_type:complete
MIQLSFSEPIMKVIISKEERITFDIAKSIIRKSRRIIQQNKAKSVIVELEDTLGVNQSALTFFKRVLCYNNDFPVTIVNS